MKLSKFLREERAVSPVIGVILMVAITVILAAVIGSFVLGFGAQIDDTVPQASMSFEFTTTGTSSASEVTVSHNGGDRIDSNEQLRLVAQGGVADGTILVTAPNTFSAGDSVTRNTNNVLGTTVNTWDGQRLRVIWESPSTDRTAVLATTTAPTE